MEFFLVLKDTLLCLGYFILIAFSSKCNYKGDKGVCGLLTKKTGCWQSTVYNLSNRIATCSKETHRRLMWRRGWRRTMDVEFWRTFAEDSSISALPCLVTAAAPILLWRGGLPADTMALQNLHKSPAKINEETEKWVDLLEIFWWDTFCNMNHPNPDES